MQQTGWQQRYALILGVLIAAIGVGSLWISGKVWGGDKEPASLMGIGYYIIPIAVVMALYLFLKRLDTFNGFGKQLPAGFSNGWYLVFAGVLLAALFYAFAPKDQLQIPSIKVVILYALVTLCTGLFEELLCRGLIQNVLMERYGDTKSGVWRSILLASGIFAVIHFANLISNPHYVLGTITQVIFAFCLGALLGTVYYLTKDLLAVALLHATFNFFGSITDILSKPLAQDAPKTDITIPAMALTLAVLLPALVVARRIFVRKAPALETN